MSRTSLDQMIDQNPGSMNYVRRQHSERNDFVSLCDHNIGGHGHQWIEVPGRQRVDEVARVIRASRCNECNIGSQRGRDEIVPPV